MLLVGSPALIALANAEEANSSHSPGKVVVASSPVYLADKNDKHGGGDHGGGNGGDHKHGGGSSGGSGSGSSSDSGDTTTTNNGDNNSSSSGSGSSDSSSNEGDNSGSGTTDNQEENEETSASGANDESGNDDSQAIPVAQEAQQQDDEQPETPLKEEEKSYPEDTYPDSYFSDRPLKKMELQRYLILDEDGNAVSDAKPGDSIKIVASYKNLQQKEQRYALITQIVDQDGVTLDVSWSMDMVESGGYIDWFKLWKPSGPAVCTIKTVVWSRVGENPVPLSETSVTAVVVQ
jgi:hypothetical protein